MPIHIQETDNTNIGTDLENATTIIVPTPAIIPLIVKGAASQSANLQEWQNSAGGVLASVGNQGHFGVGVTPNDDYVMYFTDTSILTSGHARGVYGIITANPGGASSANFRGIMGGAGPSNGNTQTFTGKLEGGFFAITTGAGGSYTIATVNGIRGQIQNTGDGTLTNAHGVYIDNAIDSVSGAITNLYGLYIDNQDVGATLNYAIYTNTGEVRLGDKLTTTAGRIVNTTRVTTTYTALITDHMIYGDTDGGAFTITLPAGVEGQEFRISNVGSGANNLTIDGNGAETVYGETTQTLYDGEVLTLIYNATEGWF